MTAPRLLRVRVLEALERRVKQFRSREDIWPFRVPHEPLALEDVLEESLAGEGNRVPADMLRSRTVLRMEWNATADHRREWWHAWVISLPSGVHVYCDETPDEIRILASVKRGLAAEADGFFLELLAESAGAHFGIELAGDLPDRASAATADRELLRDVFLDLYGGKGRDATVDSWIDRALVTPAGGRRARRLKRLREERDSY